MASSENKTVFILIFFLFNIHGKFSCMMRKKNNPCNFVIVVIILGQSFLKWKLLTGKERQLIVFIKNKIHIFEIYHQFRQIKKSLFIYINCHIKSFYNFENKYFMAPRGL